MSSLRLEEWLQLRAATSLLENLDLIPSTYKCGGQKTSSTMWVLGIEFGFLMPGSKMY